ncbi:TnsD family Tn7-like transposition protein [Pelomonas sp. SE-A7]|uniref:TnsD family Tn7-like transposition protein n=1 Tax=Pelomonas sp. SE-A7 TaxID=3054953 RepID=UPI00259CD4A5|nr:TnsD family Tn7-like transposition protein [Pelomonas sp. SE-A7]MDM4766670.1 TnsD family Tn7-like transposition protein [Pelomonas sp. SE-A7]
MATLDSFQPGLPQRWLPDETLFSLCSRYHVASGNKLPSTTCRQLFGHPRQGCAHDFPARLDHFLSVAGDALGTAASIVEEHTLLPLYLRFASPEMVDATSSAAAQSSSGRLKFQLGLLTSRFRANHPLKACRACMQEDTLQHITPYWHREHQLPGVWICSRHGGWLQSSDLKATGISRFGWLLPTPSQFLPAPSAPPPPSVTQLARMVAGLVAKPGLLLSAHLIGQTFRAALGNRGLLAGAAQRLRRVAAGEAYAEFLRPLLDLEQMGQLPASSDEAYAEIARQISARSASVHPLRRLALAAWLFDDLEDLLARMETTSGSTGTAAPAPESTAQLQDDPRRARLVDLINSGSSTSAAAKEVGIDTTTGMVWAAAAGLATPRRPKLLKGDLRGCLIALLRKGVAKEEAAAYGEVSLQTVTTLLRTEVGLHETWRQAGFENARHRNRNVWTQTTAANPLSGVKAARMAEPAAYAWLYRNDRDWLAENTAKMARPIRVPQARVDWDSRDRQFAHQVRQVALEMFEMQGVRHLRLPQLYQRIPELKAKILRLDRMPLTRAAIFAVVGRTLGR